MDSPILIETEHLIKILTAYSVVNMGTPVFYKSFQEVLLFKDRYKELSYQQLADVCKDFQRATNLPVGSQSFYDEVEKYIRTEIAQGRFIDFTEICRFSETIFSSNCGTNVFQKLLEQKLIEGLNRGPDTQEITLLIKGLSGYYLKMPYLEDLII